MPDLSGKKMHTHFEESEIKIGENLKGHVEAPDLAQIVANGVARIIRLGPTAMTQFEAEFDAFVQSIPSDVRKLAKMDVLKSIMHVKGAIESIYIRTQQTY